MQTLPESARAPQGNFARQPDHTEIRRALELLHPFGVVELRALFQRGRKRTSAGYFDPEHRAELIEAAANLNADGAAVYVNLNPLDEQLLSRYANRVEDYAQATATDANVTSRRWLLIDLDPARPKDTSATDAQLEAAKASARGIYGALQERGWPKPAVAESGNGVHLLYRIDLPNDDASRDLVKDCLNALAQRFDDAAVKVDRSVFNAARIVKLYGTVANKGDSTPTAPWRLSRLVQVPDALHPVPLEMLQALAAEVKPAERPRANGAAHDGARAWAETDVAAFLGRAGIEVVGEPGPHDGAMRWKLKACPFNPQHGPGEAAVFQMPDGRLGFKCQHSSCADRHWSDLRELVDGPRERRQGANDEKSSKSSGCSRGASENSKFAPEPLRRPMPPAAPYPTDALPEILAAAVAAAHEVIQAPAAICGQSFLAAASLAAQAHADVEIDGRIELLSLFALTIGESGERKSAVDAVALLAHREFERRRMREFGPEFAEFENARAAYETARNSILKKKAKESPSDAQERIGYELKKLGPPPEEPAKPILFTATPTLEGLHKLFVSGLPSVGLFHDDAGEFIGGHAMSDENRLKSAAGLSKLWDRGEFDRVRAGDGANKYFGRRVASHLMVQPVVAERVLSDDILTQQGLLARTLLAWPTSTIGDRPYVERDLTQHHAIQNFSRRIAELLARPWRFAEDSQHELEPPVLHLTHDAKELWVAAHDAIEADQKEGGAWVNVRPWASKGGAQILRIAGVFTVIEDPDAAMIERDAIARAARLVDWHLAEAVRIVGTAMVPTEVRNAEAVLEWCRRERRDAIHSRQAMQFGPSAIRSLDTFNAAMAVLERTGWAAPIEGGAVIDGKQRRRVWGVRWELTA